MFRDRGCCASTRWSSETRVDIRDSAVFHNSVIRNESALFRIEHFSMCKSEINSTEQVADDSCAKILQGGVTQFAANAKHLFYLESHSLAPFIIPIAIAKRLHQGKGIDDLFVPYSVRSFFPCAWMANYVCTRVQKIKQEMLKDELRFSKVSCPSCSFISTQAAFCDEDRCDLYDPHTKYAYMCDNAHYSEHGARRIVPLLKREIDRVLAYSFGEIK